MALARPTKDKERVNNLPLTQELRREAYLDSNSDPY